MNSVNQKEQSNTEEHQGTQYVFSEKNSRKCKNIKESLKSFEQPKVVLYKEKRL